MQKTHQRSASTESSCSAQFSVFNTWLTPLQILVTLGGAAQWLELLPHGKKGDI